LPAAAVVRPRQPLLRRAPIISHRFPWVRTSLSLPRGRAYSTGHRASRYSTVCERSARRLRDLRMTARPCRVSRHGAVTVGAGLPQYELVESRSSRRRRAQHLGGSQRRGRPIAGCTEDGCRGPITRSLHASPRACLTHHRDTPCAGRYARLRRFVDFTSTMSRAQILGTQMQDESIRNRRGQRGQKSILERGLTSPKQSPAPPFTGQAGSGV